MFRGCCGGRRRRLLLRDRICRCQDHVSTRRGRGGGCRRGGDGMRMHRGTADRRPGMTKFLEFQSLSFGHLQNMTGLGQVFALGLQNGQNQIGACPAGQSRCPVLSCGG